MNGQVENQEKSQSQAVANIQGKNSSPVETPKFEDNRPEVAVLQKVQMMANGASSPPAQNDKNSTALTEQLKSGPTLGTKVIGKQSLSDYGFENEKAAGLGQQIETEGEVSWRSKVGSWFGDEGTWSKFLNAVELYNKAEKIEDKQKHLLSIKNEAEEWLKQKEEKVKKKETSNPENDQKKYNTIKKFINLTTSNYPELREKIITFKWEWENCLTNSTKIHDDFDSFGKRYNALVSDLAAYKSNYPPSVNLLFHDEIKELNSHIQDTTSGIKSGLDVSYPNYGFRVNKPNINFNFLTLEINFEGSITLTSTDVISSSGKVKGELIKGNFELKIIEQINGKFKNKAIEITCENLEFDPAYGLISNTIYANAKLYDKIYTLNSDFAYLTEKGLRYEELKGKADFIDLKEHKVQAVSIELVSAEGKDLSINGILHLSDREISVEHGFLEATFNEQLQLSHLDFNRASGKRELLGQEFTLGGLGYDLAKKAVTIEFVEKEFELAGKKLILTSKNGSIGIDNKLDARIFKGKLKGEIDTKKGIVITDPEVTHDRGSSEAESSTTLEGGLALTIGDNFTASGKVKATFDSTGVKDVTILEGAVDGTYEGIKLQMTGLTYKMEGEGQLSAKTVTASIDAFDKNIALEFLNARTTKTGFDFDEISASLDKVDFGIIQATNPTLTYNKEKGTFKAALGYALDKTKLPDALNDSSFSASGGLEVEWDPDKEENRFYKIDKTDASLKLFGQSLSVKEANYNSKTKEFETKEATLSMDLGFFKGKELKGKKISFDDKKDFTFSELSLDQKEDLNFGVLTLSSDKFLLLNDDKGFKVQTNGAAKLNLPEAFQADSSAKFSGFVGVYLKNPIKPYFELTEGQANIKVANPLVELAKFLGEGWSKSRFELSATIPVFPAISAIFGVYIQLLAQMPETIDGTVKLNNDILDLALELKSKLEVEAGVFGGVQAGSQLLIALAVLLRAAAKMGIHLSVGYDKKLPVKEGAEIPKGDVDKDQGFNYALTGELKTGAYLDLVATALYFFQKTFTLELKEWTLGEFEFSSKKKELPKGGKGSEFSEDKLRENVTPEALQDAQVATMKANQLLDEKQNERFSSKQKEEILTKIKSAETGRSTIFAAAVQDKDAKKQKGELDSGGDSLFKSVAALDMQFFDQYVDKFVTWDKVLEYLEELNKASELTNLDEKKKSIKTNLMLLKDVLTIPGNFNNHYTILKDRYNSSYESYSGSNSKTFKKYLKEKSEALAKVHAFKHGIHSQFFGDENIIDAKLRSWSIIGKSPLEDLIDSYKALYSYLNVEKGTISIADKSARYKMLENALNEMIKEHQIKMEAKRSQSTKLLPSSPKP